MLRRQVIASLSLLLLIGGAALFCLLQVREEDRLAYDDLTQRSQNGASKSAAASKQRRGSVVKKMWMSTESARLEIRLTSKNSELIVSEEGAKEQMKDVTGYMQEELFYILPDGRRAHPSHGGFYRVSGEQNVRRPASDWVAMQEIRYLEAESACFDYTDHRFLAHEVEMIRFEAPGHQLPDAVGEISPMMSAAASSVEFGLHGEKLDFEAHRLQAKIFSPLVGSKTQSQGDLDGADSRMSSAAKPSTVKPLKCAIEIAPGEEFLAQSRVSKEKLL